MYFKEDWDKAKQRYNAWWNNDVLDRVAVAVTAPIEGFKEERRYNGSMVERWTNPEIVIGQHEQTFERTFYGGEAYPYVWVTLGPTIISAYLGCELVFDEKTPWTTWQKPCMKHINEFSSHSFSKDNPWYIILRQITELALERGKDRYFVSLADIGASAEVLLHMLGAEELCLAMVDEPDGVKSARDSIIALWKVLYDEMFNRIQPVMTGSCMWLNAWSSGKTYPLECDFSAMISPRNFEEFFLPEIQELSRFLDDPIYHLDGKEALQHLDLLLEIPELKAIQWCPGATAGNNQSMMQWLPILKKIQNKKKSLHIEVKANEVQTLMEALSPNGLMLRTTCSSRGEAEDLLRKVEAWTTFGLTAVK